MPPCPQSSHLMSSGSLWFLTNQRGLRRCLDLLQKGIPHALSPTQACQPSTSLAPGIGALFPREAHAAFKTQTSIGCWWLRVCRRGCEVSNLPLP